MLSRTFLAEEYYNNGLTHAIIAGDEDQILLNLFVTKQRWYWIL